MVKIVGGWEQARENDHDESRRKDDMNAYRY
jgi:hypothetical protein